MLAGSITGIDGSLDMLVARYKANGTLDATFGGGSGYVRLDIDGMATATTEWGYGVAIQPDGKIVAAGFGQLAVRPNPGYVLVARLNTNGTLDSTFVDGHGYTGFKLGVPPTGYGFGGKALALQTNGNVTTGIIVAGSAGTTDGTTTTEHPLLMRFNP